MSAENVAKLVAALPPPPPDASPLVRYTQLLHACADLLAAERDRADRAERELAEMRGELEQQPNEEAIERESARLEARERAIFDEGHSRGYAEGVDRERNRGL
jgi:hypothetical protein